MKILIIEDQQELAENISSYLKDENYVCEFAKDYHEAIYKIEEYNYDCILLDLMLPSGDGLNILKNIRSRNKQDGVIIISAKDATDDKINGLKIGADDYLAKPFHLSELSARIYSIIRRKQFESTNSLLINEISIDLLSKIVKVNDQILPLTKKEFDLMLFLIGNKNKTISKIALAEHLSGDMADMMDNHDFIYSHLKNLKKKLYEAGCKDYIKTTYGMGYRWEI